MTEPDSIDHEAATQDLVTRHREQLIAGELIIKELTPQTTLQRPSETEINEKYDKGEVRIVTEQARYPLESIAALLDSGNYMLDPEYQRRHRWDARQRSRLIESFIMNVPIPPIFLYEWDYGRYEVMDGLQRLSAVREFYADRFALTDLEYWTELEGLRYSELPDRIVAGINRRYLSSIVLLKETSHGTEDPEILKRFVFGRINTGGVQLSPQEVRNALYDGPMNRLCKLLATSPALRRLWSIPIDVEDIVERSGDRPIDVQLSEGSGVEDELIPNSWRDMTDVELVLRFFANRQRMIAYRDNIRDYLDSYLKAANKFPPDIIETLKIKFEETLSLAEGMFGEFAFRRMRGERWASVPSKSIYDALMNVLSRLLSDRDELLQRRREILAGLVDFYAKNSKVFNLRGQKRNDLMMREILFEQYLRSFIDGSASA